MFDRSKTLAIKASYAVIGSSATIDRSRLSCSNRLPRSRFQRQSRIPQYSAVFHLAFAARPVRHPVAAIATSSYTTTWDDRECSVTDTFATRLNEQAFRWERENFQRLTNKELSDWLAESGCEVSKTYLSQLRSGARTNPSTRLMEHLVGFFGVAPDYFTAPRANSPTATTPSSIESTCGHCDVSPERRSSCRPSRSST